MKTALFVDTLSDMHAPSSVELDIDALIEEDLIAWLHGTGYEVRRVGVQQWSVTRADGCVVSIMGLDRLSLYTANAQQLARVT